MAKKTVLGKVLEAVFNLFKSNWPSFVAKLYDKVPDDVKAKVSIGIMIVENVKTWLGGDTAKFITHVIPGDLDEKTRLEAIEVLKKILDITDDVIGQGQFINFNGAPSHMMASDINKHLTGLSFGQSALTTEVVYQGFKAEGKL